MGGGGCGATEISDFSRAAERRKKHYCPHPPSLPLLPSIVSEQCPRWYQLHLSTKWIRGQRQSAKSAISKALKKHTRLGIREQERALQFVHHHWSKQPQSCTDGQCGGKAGHLDFKSMAQDEEICSTLMLTTTTPSSHGHDGAPPPHHGHDKGSGAELVGPADSRAGHWVRGAGKDGTTVLLRGGKTSLFLKTTLVLILVNLGTLNH